LEVTLPFEKDWGGLMCPKMGKTAKNKVKKRKGKEKGIVAAFIRPPMEFSPTFGKVAQWDFGKKLLMDNIRRNGWNGR
jgi:hypothetical protein